MMEKALRRKIDEWEKAFAREKNLLRFCLTACLVWGLIAHAYGFLHGNFSHDSLNALYASAIEETWKIQLGRFLVPVYRAVFRGALAMPWLIGLLSLLLIGVSAYLIVKMFRVQSKPSIALICGLMATNVTVTVVSATYIYELDVDMLALLLATGAAYLWYRKSDSIPSLLWGAVMLAASIGLYQSYMAVTLSLMMLLSMMDLLDGQGCQRVIRKGLRGVAVLLLGGILYAAACRAALVIAGVSLEERTNVFAFGEAGFVGFLIDSVKRFFDTYINFGLHFGGFARNSVFPTGVVLAIDLFVALVILSLVFQRLHQRELRFSDKILTCVLGALMPFGLNVAYFLARGYMHDLMTYAYWLAYIVLIVLVWRFAGGGEMKRGLLLKGATVVSVGMLLWGNIAAANTAYLKKDLEQQSALSLMTRVVAQLEAQEDYRAGETEIAFIGVSEIFRGTPGFDILIGLDGLTDHSPIAQDTSTYYYNAYKAYFDHVLQYPVHLCGDETHAALKNHADVRSMPVFPDKGFIRTVDGVMVVKLGN